MVTIQEVLMAYTRSLSRAEVVTHCFCFALGWFLCFRYHLTAAAAADGTAVEVWAFVLFVHPDQAADVGIGGRGALQLSVLLLLLQHRLLALGVLATLTGQERVPNFPILLGATGPAQLYGRVLTVSSRQERANSSTSGSPSACAVSGGVFTETRFGVCCFGTDAGHQSALIGSRLGAGLGG